MIESKNQTRQTPPDLPWAKITETVLGPDYQLSLVFIGRRQSHQLNLKWRGKDKATNVLAFPLDKTGGEIFINLNQAQTEAVKFNRSPADHIGALFIHALLHLKGYRHSSTMEKRESALRQTFNLNGQIHINRRGYRHRFSPSGGL